MLDEANLDSVDPLDLKNPRCKLDGTTPVTRETKHMFMELDKLQPEVESFFEDPVIQSTWSPNATSITAAWLKQGLKARSITRDYKWGTKVPLPGFEDKVVYSWFDAPIGYISITANYTDQWEKWWRDPDNVQLYQFMGKDNVVFHSVIFPASLIGTRDRWTKLRTLSACEYLTYEGGKFSKSRGVGVFGDSAQKSGVSSDVWRFYLLSHRPETGDADFEWDAFIAANNSVLLNNFGNFVSRVVKFIAGKNYNSVVPSREIEDPSFKAFKDEVNVLLTQYIDELDAVKLRAGIATVLQISQLGNGFLQSNNLTNRLAEEEPQKCNTVINYAVNLIHLLASLMEPYIPDTSASINKQLNTTPLQIPDQWNVDSISAGHKIGTPELLFRRIPPEKAAEWRDLYGNQEAQKAKAEEVSKKAAKKAARKDAAAKKSAKAKEEGKTEA
jgi:methionyl-tRNA synthetase